LGRADWRAATKAARKAARRAARRANWKWALRLLRRRCGALSAEQEANIRALSLERLEALAEALLDFESPADLAAWLAAD